MERKRESDMGRVTVELTVANYYDVQQAKAGQLAAEKVRKMKVVGVVDTGATRLVLPAKVVKQLGLPRAGSVKVRYADERSAKRELVRDAWLELLGRSGNFSAISEPSRTEALIGAIVMEDLDLIVDCATQSLRPRDPKMIVAEVE